MGGFDRAGGAQRQESGGADQGVEEGLCGGKGGRRWAGSDGLRRAGEGVVAPFCCVDKIANRLPA
jgi:hypothetical protein